MSKMFMSKVMRTAIISDVHANITALEAVLKDISNVGADRIICLGDNVDYGPRPKEVIDLTKEVCAVNIAGNHEADVTGTNLGFCEYRGTKIFTPSTPIECRLWTQRKLGFLNGSEKLDFSSLQHNKLFNYLACLPLTYQDNSFSDGSLFFSHAVPFGDNFIHTYLSLEGIAEISDIAKVSFNEFLDDSFSMFERFCFVGHSHVPRILFKDITGEYFGGYSFKDILRPSIISFKDICSGKNNKAIICVGSVGQPRNGDSCACYALINEEGVEFRSVDYDSLAVVNEIGSLEENEMFSYALRYLVTKRV